MTKLDDMVKAQAKPWSSKRGIVSKTKIGRGMVIDFGQDVFRFEEDGSMLIYNRVGQIIPRELVYRGDDGFAFLSDSGTDTLCYVDRGNYYQIYGVRTQNIEHLL